MKSCTALVFGIATLSLFACGRSTENEVMSSVKTAEIEDAEMYFRELSLTEQRRWQSMMPSTSPIFTQVTSHSGDITSASVVAQILRAQSYFSRRDGDFHLLEVMESNAKPQRHIDVVATPTDIFLSDDGSILGYRFFDGSAKVMIVSRDEHRPYNIDGYDVLAGVFSNRRLIVLARVKDEVVVLSLADGAVTEITRESMPDTDLLPGLRCEQRRGDGIVHVLSTRDGRSFVVRVDGNGQLIRGGEFEGRWVQCFAAGDRVVGVERTDTGILNLVDATVRAGQKPPAFPEGAGRVVFSDSGEILAAYRSDWSASEGMVPAVWLMGERGLEPVLYHDGGFGPRGSALGVAWFAGRPVLLGQHSFLEYRDGVAVEIVARGLNTNELAEFRSGAMAFYDIAYQQVTVVPAA